MAWDYIYTDGYVSVDMNNNAQLIYDYLTGKGVTAEATCAIIANMQSESGLNPGQWEHPQTGQPSNVGKWSTAGFGLGQWTPASKVSNYVKSQEPAIVSDGYKQLDLLLDVPSQWSTRFVDVNGYSSYYNLTGVPYFSDFASFLASTQDAGDLAVAYMVCWERPNKKYADPANRRSQGEYWYSYFGGQPSTGYPIRLHAQGNCNPFATLHIDGTYADRIYKADEGTDVFIHANVGEGDYFEIWTVDSGGVTIDFETQETTFFTMHANAVDITAHATGETPTPPEPPTPTRQTIQTGNMPIWMYPMFTMKGV